MRMLVAAVLVAAGLVLGALAGTAQAQEAWVQVEAHPTLGEGEAAARRYAPLGPVEGWRLGSGWYAVALGPYPAAEAAALLRRLRIAGAIPRDSFVADGARFEARFYPPDGAAPAVAAPAVTPAEADPAEAVVAEETVAEARAGERLLSREERERLQVALKAQGVYAGAVDGAFGPGTRAAMAAWQAQAGRTPTGVLTSAERAALLAAYDAPLEGLGLERVVDAEAGIALALPMAVFARGAPVPPFVPYRAAEGSDAAGIEVILLSGTGGRATLSALYDVLQTLEVVPFAGERSLTERSFAIRGEDARRVTEAEARIEGDAVKGFVLVWPAGDEARRTRVLAEMRASFEALPGALGAAPTPAAAAASAGTLPFEVRRPERVRTGFYVDAAGRVLTAAEAVAGCGRVTLGRETPARLVAEDAGLGLALLEPEARLAPMSIAALAPAAPGAEIAAAGFSYEGRLGAPTLAFGAVAAEGGLDGDARLQRLALAQTPGDAGAPVLDAAGGVVGLLLPRSGEADRRLPDGVSFAASATALEGFLEANGVRPSRASGGAALAAEDLAALGTEMSVMVACWN